MPKGKPATHCRKCGRPFAEAGQFYDMALCRTCGLAWQRAKNRRLRLKGVYAKGSRIRETGNLDKITGIARLLRDRRIARYRRCVEQSVPIVYEPYEEF